MGFFDRLTGKTAAKAATKAADVQVQAGKDASALLDPFASLGQTGIDQAGFLTDPQAQFDYLQNNPLFQLSLDNANTQTNQLAAARGRLSAGDTLQQLSNNTLLAAQPLITDQKNSINNLLNLGVNTASNQGNLTLGQGASLAGGIVGSENARSQGQQNLLDIGGKVAQVVGFSDPKLKENINLIGSKNGFNIYEWNWNCKAELLGLIGKSVGVMADEVKRIMPKAISYDKGFMKVDYSMIGVK